MYVTIPLVCHISLVCHIGLLYVTPLNMPELPFDLLPLSVKFVSPATRVRIVHTLAWLST